MADNFLTEKMGPLPLWGWLGVTTLVIIAYVFQSKKKASQQQTQNAANTAAQQALATQAAAVTTVPYTTATTYGGNYGNGYSGGQRGGRNWSMANSSAPTSTPTPTGTTPSSPTPQSPLVNTTNPGITLAQLSQGSVLWTEPPQQGGNNVVYGDSAINWPYPTISGNLNATPGGTLNPQYAADQNYFANLINSIPGVNPSLEPYQFAPTPSGQAGYHPVVILGDSPSGAGSINYPGPNGQEISRST